MGDEIGGGDGLIVLGREADADTLGARVRLFIESLGGRPAFDDRTMGVLWAVHRARGFHYYDNAVGAFVRVMRRTCGGGPPRA